MWLTSAQNVLCMTIAKKKKITLYKNSTSETSHSCVRKQSIFLTTILEFKTSGTPTV